MIFYTKKDYAVLKGVSYRYIQTINKLGRLKADSNSRFSKILDCPENDLIFNNPSHKRGSLKISKVERFWSKVNKSGDCWIWEGWKDSNGYGHFNLNKKSWLTHRLSYHLTFGEIPANIFICHRCDNPSCVNPAHLFPGSQKDNNNDRAAKGRSRNGNMGKTHCKRGHELTGANLVQKSKSRLCRICNNESNKNSAKRFREKLKSSKIQNPYGN